MFVVQFENITCHWEFSVQRAGLRLVKLKAEAGRKCLGFPKYRHVRFAAPTIFHIIFLSISLSLSLSLSLPIASLSPTLYPFRLFISHRFFTYPLNHLSQIFYLNSPISVSF
jgi:hypothetical protein